jgi:hypothetical protein
MKFVLAMVIVLLVFAGCIQEKGIQEKGKEKEMKLSSLAIEDGKPIPIEYTCDGADISPPLTFGNIPKNAKSLSIIMLDPDAPGGTFVHWLVWNIPSNITGFLEGENITFPQGTNDFGNIGYNGPCPPPGKKHRYFFKLYALDTFLDLNQGATREELEEAMSGHIVGETQLMGTYTKH